MMNILRSLCLLALVATAVACSTPSGQTSGNADSTTKDSVQQDTVKDTYNPAAAPASNGQF